MTISGLSTITSNYGHLNGVDTMYYGGYGCYGGYGGYGYGGGVWGKASAEHAKERVANNYDVYATQQGYRSKQGVESMNYKQQCMLLAQDLKEGEADQASERFDEILKSMKNTPQYANYSDSELCTLIRDTYAEATGSNVITDINKNTSGAFVQGLKRGFPVLGLMANKYSKSDLVAQVTEGDKSKGEIASKTLGYMTGGAVGTAAIATGVGAIIKNKSTVSNAASGISGTIGKIVGGGKKQGKWALIGVAVMTGIAAIASLIESHHTNKKTNEK